MCRNHLYISHMIFGNKYIAKSTGLQLYNNNFMSIILYNKLLLIASFIKAYFIYFLQVYECLFNKRCLKS